MVKDAWSCPHKCSKRQIEDFILLDLLEIETKLSTFIINPWHASCTFFDRQMPVYLILKEYNKHHCNQFGLETRIFQRKLNIKRIFQNRVNYRA